MSTTNPDPVSGRDDPFRSDDEQREESETNPENEGSGIGIALPLVGGTEKTADRDEPGDRAYD